MHISNGHMCALKIIWNFFPLSKLKTAFEKQNSFNSLVFHSTTRVLMCVDIAALWLALLRKLS